MFSKIIVLAATASLATAYKNSIYATTDCSGDATFVQTYKVSYLDQRKILCRRFIFLQFFSNQNLSCLSLNTLLNVFVVPPSCTVSVKHMHMYSRYNQVRWQLYDPKNLH